MPCQALCGALSNGTPFNFMVIAMIPTFQMEKLNSKGQEPALGPLLLREALCSDRECQLTAGAWAQRLLYFSSDKCDPETPEFLEWGRRGSEFQGFPLGDPVGGHPRARTEGRTGCLRGLQGPPPTGQHLASLCISQAPNFWVGVLRSGEEPPVWFDSPPPGHRGSPGPRASAFLCEHLLRQGGKALTRESGMLERALAACSLNPAQANTSQ